MRPSPALHLPLLRPLLPPRPTTAQRKDIPLTPAQARTLVRASLEWAPGASAATLILVLPTGPTKAILIGPCVCCQRPWCPQGAHEATAKRILRGDSPRLWRAA